MIYIIFTLLSLLIVAWDSVFAKSATVSCLSLSRSLTLRGWLRRFFSSNLINLIHFIFYGSIREERKPSLRTCVLLHFVSCINLTKGRKGGQEATGGKLDASWHGSGWIIRENLRPARHTPVDALRLVSDKQHFVASRETSPARCRENENLSPAFEIARWRKRLRAFSYLETISLWKKCEKRRYRRRLFFLHSLPIDNRGNLIFLQTVRLSALSVRTCCNFFPNTRCNLQRSHESEIRYYLIYLKRYLVISHLQMQRALEYIRNTV